MVKKIGVFGGGFDPIHIGHIHMALQVQEREKLDQILLIPAYCSPFKWENPPRASVSDRLEMIKLVCKEIPFFSYSDWEIRQERPSYTIDTLRYLKTKKEYQEAELYLLLTEEGETGFSSWKESFEIIELATPLVGVREKKKKSSFIQVDTKIMQISSSEIRERVSQGKCIKHLVLAPVLQYIQEHDLYKKDI